MTINRITGAAKGRSPAVHHNGIVYAVATAGSGTSSVAEQTRLTLARLEQNLNAVGSDKTCQATVYLRDMSTKAEMDEVWCEWIGDAENWPQRACVGADLAGNVLVEIVTVAAAK